MIHARTDYMRIQDPENKIREDEPVFLVRAQDNAFIETVTEWIKVHLSNGGDPAVGISVARHLGRAIAWREQNMTKNADAPHEVLK